LAIRVTVNRADEVFGTRKVGDDVEASQVTGGGVGHVEFGASATCAGDDSGVVAGADDVEEFVGGVGDLVYGGWKPVTVHTSEDMRLWHRWSGRRRIYWCGERSIEVCSVWTYRSSLPSW
jgi:hypothetical protein